MQLGIFIAVLIIMLIFTESWVDYVKNEGRKREQKEEVRGYGSFFFCT